MGEPLRQRTYVPLIDLETIREALVYIRDDIKRVPGYERAAEALTTALSEIAVAERRRLAPQFLSLIDTRALPRRKH
jgi:hypothetical protein